MLVKGNKLSAKLRAEVLTRFIYRWTTDNQRREAAWRAIGQPTIPLISDEQWLAEHAFHVTASGELSRRHHHAEPHYLADSPGDRYTAKCLMEV